MSIKPKILVTSAAGKTGLQTALQLREKGYPVRAFVRRDDHRAKRLKEAGAEVFVGDQYALADMRRAMTGVQRAYHCAPTAPNGLHFGAVFAIAAQENRIEHVVTLSQWLSHSDHPSVYTREVWLNDAILNLLPDTTVTVNNVGWFADNYFMVLEPAAQLGLLTMPLGDGDVKGNAPPSTEDIAAVSVGALIDPATHAGKIYRPTGPALLSPNDIAAVLTTVLDRKVKYQNISESMFLKALTALQPPGFTEATLTQLRLYTEEYRRGAFAVSAPTDAVQVVSGREPEDFETITRRYAASRTEAVQTPANKLRAMRNFIKILATATPDPDRIERQLNHVLLESPTFAGESMEWRRYHQSETEAAFDTPLQRPNEGIVPVRAAR